MTNDGGDGEQIMRRAHRLAIGLADTGLSQAEEMLRRVSPQGREQARREREARARRRNRLVARFAMAALASVVVLVLLAQIVVPAFSVLAAAAVMLGLTMLILSQARPHAPGRVALADSPLAALPAQAGAWLASQRRALPSPAMRLADELDRRLDELTPQLAGLDPREPAGDAVRKLVATELPDLVEGWRAVPPSLRAVPRGDGRTPDAQLVDGLRLIDDEIARVTEQLARGALDEVAPQRRYLELKYRGDDGRLLG